MKNFVQHGNTLTLPAPYDVVSGAGFQVGALFAIAIGDAAASAQVEGVTCGVYTLPKSSNQAWAIGARIYWDDVNKRCDSDSAKGRLIGVATVAAANPSAVGYVRLNGGAVGNGGSAATAPGQPAKPLLTAMAGAVSLAWTPGAAGSTATTSNTWTDINGNVTQLTTNPQTITAPAGTPYTGTVTTLNAQGAGPASPQADAVTVGATTAFKNTGTMRLVGTQAQILYPAPVNFSGGRSSRIIKLQAPGPAIGCRISVHNLSPTVGVDYVKASIAATDIAAFDTPAKAYNAYADGVMHNVTASGADPLGFNKATWGGAPQSRRLEPSNAVLPSFGYDNQQDTVTSDVIMGLVPKRATDRTNEEYYYLLRLTIGTVQNLDGMCTPTVGTVTGLISEYTNSNGADAPLCYGGDLGLVDGVDGGYTIPAALKPEAMPVFTVEWIYPQSLAAITILEDGDSITEGYKWPRLGSNRKSTPARPLHHVNLGGSTTRTESFLGNMYLYLQTNAKPDYVLMPIISVNNYSPLSSFNLASAQAEFTRLQAVEAFLTGLGIKIIWWTPFNFGANPASSDTTSAWGYLYNSAKAYAASKGITFMDINGDSRMVRSVYNASGNPTGWIDPDNTHPSNPAGINGFAAVYTDTLTSLGF